MEYAQLESLVDLYGGILYSFCRYLTYSKEDADDLYQDTFLEAVKHYKKIDMDQNPKAYLISTALYKFRSNKRKYARRFKIAPVVDFDSQQEVAGSFDLEETVLSRELTNWVRGEINCLQEKYRVVLYLYYTAGLKQDEIARTLKLPKGTVKSRLYKAKQLVKKRLEVKENAKV